MPDVNVLNAANRPVLTQGIVAIYDEVIRIKPTSALRALFKPKLSKLALPTVAVRRGTEQLAPDVVLGSKGNRVQLTNATYKTYQPFYFAQTVDLVGLQAYQVLFSSQSWSENDGVSFLQEFRVALETAKDQIERTVEYWCSQILETGTFTSFVSGTQVNFGRLAGSMVDLGAGNYWAATGTNPYKDLENGCVWIRQYGKRSDSQFNALFGQQAWNDFITNSTVMGRQMPYQMKLDDIVAPNRLGDGSSYMGTITAGSYTIHCWTYPQFFDMPGTNVKTAYWPTTKVVIFPPDPDFELISAAVPQLPVGGTNSLVVDNYVMKEYINEYDVIHEMKVESRPIPVPIAIDTMYTITAVAS